MTLLMVSIRIVNSGDSGVWGLRVLDTGEQSEEILVTHYFIESRRFQILWHYG